MSEELLVMNSGVQTVLPPLATTSPQIVYLDFDGAETSYVNRDLDIAIDHVVVEDSGFDSETIMLIVTVLNDQFGDDIVFTAELPQTDEYSTIYVGVTSAFDVYGDFHGLAETIDSDNQIHNDNAFVFLNSTASTNLVTSVIAHEAEHIVNGMEHEGEGLEKYAETVSIHAETSTGLIVSSSMHVFVWDATIASTTVNSGGWLYVSSGGTATYTTVNSGGSLFVSSGGTATYTTVNLGGQFSADSSGTVKQIMEVGGFVAIEAVPSVTFIPSVISNLSLSSWQKATLHSVTTAVSATVNSRGYLYVLGGTATYTTVNSWGSLSVSSGGTAAYSTVNSWGSLSVSNGGTATYTTVNSWGSLSVSSGTAVSTILNSMGNILVYNGGKAISTFVSGSYDNTNVGNARLVVFNGGEAQSTTIGYGGYLDVSSGGTADSIVVDHEALLEVASGGTALNILENGGRVWIDSGAVATFASNVITNIEWHDSAKVHCQATLHSGTTAVSLLINGGRSLIIYQGGKAFGTTLDRYGYIVVSSGGTATNTTLKSWGSLCVSSGGTAANATVNSGGKLYVSSGGTAANATVNVGGELYVSSGGKAENAIVHSEGELDVSSGGLAENPTVSSEGILYVHKGGTATGIVAEPGACLWLTLAPNTYQEGVSGGSAFAFSNSLSGWTVNSGVWLDVISGGIASDVTVNILGELDVYSGGTAVAATVNSGGKLDVYSGGTVATATVNSGGKLDVYSGGTAKGMTINSGGSLHVSTGGNLNGSIVVGGVMTLSGTAVASNAQIVFDIAQRTTSDAIIVNDIALIGAAGYYVTVSVNQAEGRYKLAGNTADFSQNVTLTVKNMTLTTQLARGATATIGEKAYTLDVVDGVLSLDVAAAANGSTYVSETVSSGSLVVSNGDNALSTTVLARGSMLVSNGGRAEESKVGSRGYLYVFSGGIANSTTVSSAGSVYVCDGGTVYSAMVNSGGSLVISSGGTALEVVENGGYVWWGGDAVVTFVPNVISNLDLIADRATVHSGTTMASASLTGLSSITGGIGTPGSGWITNYVISGAVLSVFEGGRTVSTTVNSYGYLNVLNNGMAQDTLIGQLGTMTVSNGGTVVSAFVSSGGELVVSSGGTATGIEMSSKATLEFTVAAGTFIEGTSNGSAFTVTSIARSFGIDSGCLIKIESGGTAVSASVSSGGRLVVSNNGSAVGIENVGSLTLDAESFAMDVLLVSGGMMSFAGGIEHLTVDYGATASNVSNGAKTAVLRGSVQLGGTLTLTKPIDATDATVLFNIELRSTSDDVIINDIALIGPAGYYVTVSANQAEGLYRLAGNAAAFNHSVTVCTTDGTCYGSLSVGDSLCTASGICYSLIVGGDGTLLFDVKVNELPAPTNLSGNSARLSWSSVEGASGYVVEYSQDGFATCITVETATTGLEHYNVGAGTWQWRVRAKEGSAWAVGNNISISTSGTTPSVVSATADGVKDAFFVKPYGTWDSTYRARHMGVSGVWEGTGEKVVFGGENRFGDIFRGSTDENVMLLTDDANGDALFIDDIYTASKNNLANAQARLANIKEIRAGAGNDIVDLTSDKFAYTGGGLSIHGGLGDDVIWSNAGDNFLFGDDGNDRLVGASGNDVIVGGIGNDSMHGGGGNDIFAFGGDWGNDTVEQLEDGGVTLWFDKGSTAKWNASTLTYTDGDKSVRVSGVAASNVTLKFGDDGGQQYGRLLEAGAFDEFASERIFENRNTRGTLA